MRKLKAFAASFRCRILFSVILLLVPAIFLPTALVARMNSRQLRAKDEAQAEAIFAIAQENLQTMRAEITRASYVAQSSLAVDEYLFENYRNALEKVSAKRAFDSLLSDVFFMCDYVTDILFIKEDDTLVGSSLDWHYSLETDTHPLLDDAAFQANRDSLTPVWIGAFDANFLTQNFLTNAGQVYRSGNRICCVSRLKYTYSGSSISHNIAILIAVDEAEIRKSFSCLVDGVSDLLLINTDGGVLSSNDPALLGARADFLEGAPKEPFGSFSYTDASGEPYYVIYSRIPNFSWTLVKRTPAAAYTAVNHALWKSVLITASVALVCVGALYGFLMRWVCKPLDDMTGALVAVRNGDWEMRLPEDGKAPSEMRMMAEQMNRMLDTLRDLISLNERSEQEKYRLEMRSLQAQITPHFLFNTLSSIRWMSAMSGADNVARMLTSFVRLLRPVFGDWTTEWSLREEIAYAENYIALLRMRYDNRVDVRIDCDGEYLDIPLPRFTLQPILENACEHGMRAEKPLLVRVDVSREGGALLIRVEDDGVGMSADALRALRERLQQEDEPAPAANGHRSIGLYNIHKRLRLYYGDECGLRVDSSPEKGTRVEVRVVPRTGSAE